MKIINSIETYKDRRRNASYNPLHEHFCAQHVSCISTCLSIHYLISIYTATTLISQTDWSEEYRLLYEAILIDRALFGNISR